MDYLSNTIAKGDKSIKIGAASGTFANASILHTVQCTPWVDLYRGLRVRTYP